MIEEPLNRRPVEQASELLNEEHPLYPTLCKWVKTHQPSKRQARKFLAAFPQYKECRQASPQTMVDLDKAIMLPAADQAA